MKHQNVYAFAAFVRIGQETAIHTMHIAAVSRTIARAIAEREAVDNARHEADAMAATYGNRASASVTVAAL